MRIRLISFSFLFEDNQDSLDVLLFLFGTSLFMSSSNYCFLTCIQISQETGQVVWYSHLFQNFPQFIVIHTVKGFGIINKAEIDVFLELSCFFHDPADVGNLISGSSAFSKTSLNILKFTVHVLLTPGCILSPCLFYLYAEYIMRNAGLEEAQAGLKIAGRNINNLR